MRTQTTSPPKRVTRLTGPQASRRWPVTLAVAILTPLVLAGCGWLNQGGSTLLMTGCAVVLMLTLVVAGAFCGAGPGTCAAVLGFAFALFSGPALNDYVLEKRGERYEAAIAGIKGYHRKHHDGRTCTVVRSDSGRPVTYKIDDSQGCDEDLEPLQRVTLVVDPDDWLATRLSTDVKGLTPGHAWTCGGLLAGMEASILYGRLRRRPRPA
ncbi:hypothetical protein [Streptomyces sp. URMC 124]|uniref:hypothetical protein n=1 Tax=Streptomyces sp. URMC 124 TaxID=3423405 RepID=UPI003F1DAE05